MMSVELLKDSPGGTNNDSTGSSDRSQKSEIDGMIGISSKFALLNHPPCGCPHLIATATAIVLDIHKSLGEKVI